MENTKPGMGNLIIQTYTADQAMPVSGAHVIITKTVDEDEELVWVTQTDRSGRTEPIPLAAPPAGNSLTPDGGIRFYKYNVRVDSPGYYTMENLDVNIFEGQTAIQPFALIPLAINDESGRRVTTVEEESEFN